MKSWLVSYARYNEWANRRLTDCLMSGVVQVDQPVVSSFPGIMPTLMHMWDAEHIWWQRVKMKDQIDRPSESFSGDLQKLTQHLLLQSAEWANWVSAATEAALAHEFIYRNNKREQFKQPVADVLIHLFNHQSYHRGQIVTMLRQLGAMQIPALDYIVFTRKGK